MIPYGRQSINQADIDAVVAVLRSDWITQGPAIERFEKLVASYCGAKYAVAVSSATAGLHLACMALGLKPGEKLWTSPNTFVASANCGLYCGAGVDFVDIDPRTYNLSVSRLAEKLARAEREGALPKVVVPVHFAGQSCDMEAIAALGRRYGFQVLEDAAHAVGGRYRGEPIGCCRYSEAAVFSFHPVKIITTGEGGVVVTNREEVYQKLLRLRSHGITRQPELMDGPSEGPWYYQQLELGFDYRMTDFQAALGASQMTRLEEFVARRRELARRYDERLRDWPLTVPWQHPDAGSSWHLYVVRMHSDKIGKTHRQIVEELRATGLGVNVHYIPVHTQPFYRRLGFTRGQFPESERYYEEAVTLPLYPAMTDDEFNQVTDVLSRVVGI